MTRPVVTLGVFELAHHLLGDDWIEAVIYSAPNRKYVTMASERVLALRTRMLRALEAKGMKPGEWFMNVDSRGNVELTPEGKEFVKSLKTNHEELTSHH